MIESSHKEFKQEVLRIQDIENDFMDELSNTILQRRAVLDQLKRHLWHSLLFHSTDSWYHNIKSKTYVKFIRPNNEFSLLKLRICYGLLLLHAKLNFLKDVLQYQIQILRKVYDAT